MASIADQILIKMGLDSSQLEAGLNRSKQQIGATTQAMDKMGAKWTSTAKMLTTTILAPVAGFMSLGAVIKSYFGGVAQVAQMTGAYNTKMEEWRKKRAMLARYNREDIELYKKGREAVTKFQITMDDLSAKIMRSVSPAVKWLIDKLNDFSNWIDRNQNNIIRFLGVVAGTITALLIPSFIKLGIAMLTNPLTWIIALLGILILIIDDLVTYLRGGDSALGAFWKPLIEYTKTAWEWITKLYNAFVNSTAFKAFSLAYSSIIKHLTNGLSQLWDLCVEVFNAIMSGGEDLNGLIEVIVGVFNVIGGVLETLIGSMQLLFGGLIAVFTGDTEALKNAWIVVCDGLATASKGAFKIIDGIFKSVKNLFTEIIDVINSLIDAILDFGSSIVSALNIDALVDKAKEKLTGIFSHLLNGIRQLWDLITEFLTSSDTELSGWGQAIKGIFTSIGSAFESIIGLITVAWGALIAVFTGDTSVLEDAWVVFCDSLKTGFNGVKNTFLGIFQVLKDNFNGLLDTVNSLIDAILNFGSSIVKALNIDGLVDKAKEKLTNILPDWVKSSLGINEDGKQTEQPTIHEGTDAPIVPDVQSAPIVPNAPIVPDVQNMQAINAQSKGNVNNNINRSQVINVGSNNPAVVTATMREADYEMNNADRAIAMASQGAGW